MSLATTNMVSLTNNSSVSNNDGTNHRVGTCTSYAIGSQLQTTPHEFFIC